MHESLDEFKFRPDTATNSRVICPCMSEKLMYNVVNTLAPLFLIGSSFLLVRRTTIRSRPSSKFDQIGLWTAELAALGRLEKSPLTYNGRNLVNTLAPSFLARLHEVQKSYNCSHHGRTRSRSRSTLC